MSGKTAKARRHRKIWLVSGILLAAFLIFNLIWFLNYRSYGTVSGDYERYNGMYVKEDSREFDYTWSGPDYPSFNGNYAITNADDTLSLIIWPKSLFREESWFGLQMYDDVWKEGYMFYVDRDMNYSDAENPEFSEREKEKILDWMEKRDAEIRQLKELAEAEWKI